MKRIILSLAVTAAITAGAMAQTTTPTLDNAKEISDAKGKIEKSNLEINDAKKGILPKTWENRGVLFMSAFEINNKSNYSGMQAAKTEKNMFNNMELLLGAPTAKAAEGEYEVWTYPTIKFYVLDNSVSFWKETSCADPDALTKACEALKKAIEIDDQGKGTLKSSKKTAEEFSRLRQDYMTMGINEYYAKNYAAASKAFAGAESLSNMPKTAKDTLDGQYAYYGGLSAAEAGNKEAAITLFKKSIEHNYQPGFSYHKIYESYIDLKQEDMALKYIMEAYEKYPQEESVLYDVINYYLAKQQTVEAEKYLDKAIAKYPQNKNLYIVKAGMYVTQNEQLTKDYQSSLQKADSLRKAAYRARNEQKKHDEILSQQNAELAKAQSIKDTWMSNFDKSEKTYNLVLSKDPQFFDARFGLGMIYYYKSELSVHEINAINPSEDKDGSKAAVKEAEQKEAWKASVGQFEKASQIKPDDKNTLSNMKMIYYKLGEYEKMNAVKEKLNNL